MWYLSNKERERRYARTESDVLSVRKQNLHELNNEMLKINGRIWSARRNLYTFKKEMLTVNTRILCALNMEISYCDARSERSRRMWRAVRKEQHTVTRGQNGA
jgi:hypothetical protein